MLRQSQIINFNKNKDILLIEVDYDLNDEKISKVRKEISNQVGGKIPPDSILILNKSMRMKGMIVNE